MIKRKWAFVVGIIFAIFAIYQLATGTSTNTNDAAYNLGNKAGTIFLPLLFLVIAFLPKKKK